MKHLKEHQIDLIVLAGYLRIIGKTLLEAYPKRIVNIHPSLLPSFPGLHGIEEAFHYGVKITGITIHYVDSGLIQDRLFSKQPPRLIPKIQWTH